MTFEELEQAVLLADKIINGNETHEGMNSCLDPYYNGAWDEDLKEFNKIAQKLKPNSNED